MLGSQALYIAPPSSVQWTSWPRRAAWNPVIMSVFRSGGRKRSQTPASPILFKANSKRRSLQFCLHFTCQSLVTWSFLATSEAAAAAAKSPQSCLTLCDPIDGSPPGSPVPGILQARILEWVAISFSNACMHAKWHQSCPTLLIEASR